MEQPRKLPASKKSRLVKQQQAEAPFEIYRKEIVGGASSIADAFSTIADEFAVVQDGTGHTRFDELEFITAGHIFTITVRPQER